MQVALLTLAWGGSLLLGRCDLDAQGRAVPRTLTRGAGLLRTGVTADADVRNGAAAMLASLALYAIVQARSRKAAAISGSNANGVSFGAPIPYAASLPAVDCVLCIARPSWHYPEQHKLSVKSHACVQLEVCDSSAATSSKGALHYSSQVPAALGDASEPRAALIGGVACLVACLAYCGYQVAFPELQRRKIAAAHRKRCALLSDRLCQQHARQFIRPVSRALTHTLF